MKKDKVAARLIKLVIHNLFIINALREENLSSAMFFLSDIIESKEVRDGLIEDLKASYDFIDYADGVKKIEFGIKNLQSVATIYY